MKKFVTLSVGLLFPFVSVASVIASPVSGDHMMLEQQQKQRKEVKGGGKSGAGPQYKIRKKY